MSIAQDYSALMVGRVFVGLGVGSGLAVSFSNSNVSQQCASCEVFTYEK